MNMIHDNATSTGRHDALSRLLEVTLLMTEDMQRGLAERGITLARAHLLWELGAAERLTQKQLADTLKVTPRNVTALIDALEGDDLVRRTAHPTDRRAIVVVLTDKGERMVARLRSEMQDFADLLFTGVSQLDLDRFTAVLGKVAGRLSDLAPPKPGGSADGPP